MNLRPLALALLALLAWPGGRAAADLVYPAGGGEPVEGLVAGEADGTLTLELADGTRRDFPPGSFARLERRAASAEFNLRREYFRRRAAVPLGDADGHYLLALWCHGRGLAADYLRQLELVVALDPEHAEARRRLGYVLWAGEWLPHDEAMRRQGYVLVNGRWQHRDRQEWAAAQALRDRINSLLVRHASAPDHEGPELRGELAGLDPRQVAAALLARYATWPVHTRREIIALLEDLGAPGAQGLTDLALCETAGDLAAEARAALGRCAGEALRRAVRLALEANLGLDNPKYVRLNAARALATLANRESVPALIEALAFRGLITGRSLAPGGDDPEGREFRLPLMDFNPDALQALRSLTGQDFGFQQEPWRAWARENGFAIPAPAPPASPAASPSPSPSPPPGPEPSAPPAPPVSPAEAPA